MSDLILRFSRVIHREHHGVFAKSAAKKKCAAQAKASLNELEMGVF